jgi:hypothetical protein
MESGSEYDAPRTNDAGHSSDICVLVTMPLPLSMGQITGQANTFRHSYKSWMASAKVEPSQMKDLMRHSDIASTMNV